MLKPTTKRNIKRIIPFGVIWLVSGWVFLIVESAASENFQQLPSTSIRMDFQIFFFSSIAMTAVGLLTGIIELKYLDRAFSKKRFVTRFLGKFLVYTLLFFIVVLMTFPIAASLELNVGLFNPRVWERYIDFFYSMSHLSTGIQLATALLLSLFYSEISEFIGQNALISFFTGKYHEPVEEERIFMFLDMKSSTTIAEKLGHLNYFGFLREYYQLLH
jgi:adenylate cyclase